MRTYAFVIAAMAAAFIVLPGSAFAQSGRCEELRLACEHKGALGEQGAGNCKEYRATCQRQPSLAQICRQLRHECLHKDEMGLQGAGTCERYRETCHG
jgi:hypothetical protein